MQTTNCVKYSAIPGMKFMGLILKDFWVIKVISSWLDVIYTQLKVFKFSSLVK